MRILITKRRVLFAGVIGLGISLIVAEVYVLSPGVREIAIAGAEYIGADGFVVGRLSDHDTDVRAAAGNTLTRRGEKAVPALIRGLDDSDPMVRKAAAFTLGRIGPLARSAIPALLQRAKSDSDESVCERAGLALGLVGQDDPDTVAELLVMLDGGGDASRIAAARAASNLGESGERAVPGLIRALGAPNATLREEAAESLGALGPASKPAIPALIAALRDPNPEVQMEVVEALGRLIRRPDFNDPDLRIQVDAAVAAAMAARSRPSQR